jgi:hypothetical protein
MNETDQEGPGASSNSTSHHTQQRAILQETSVMAMNPYVHPYYDSSLSDSQGYVLTIVPIFSSLLSALGSANIIYAVLTSRKKSPYRRIMLGLSCCDFISSLFVYPWQGFLLPKETSQRILAFGNDASCTALGFGQQFALSSSWYNGALSTYFMMTVKFGISQTDFARKFEAWLHILSIFYPLITAIVGAILGVYHEIKVGIGCWVAEYPEGCGCNAELDEHGECCISSIIGWVFGGAPAILVFVAILVNNLLVFLHVRRTIHRGRRHTIEAVQSHTIQSHDPQIKRIQMVASQAFLYVVAYLLTYCPILTIQILEAYGFYPKDEARFFPLFLINAVFFPLQGFLNMFIYVRPTYLKARKEFPQETRRWAFQHALHGDMIASGADSRSKFRATISRILGYRMSHLSKSEQQKKDKAGVLVAGYEASSSSRGKDRVTGTDHGDRPVFEFIERSKRDAQDHFGSDEQEIHRDASIGTDHDLISSMTETQKCASMHEQEKGCVP